MNQSTLSDSAGYEQINISRHRLDQLRTEQDYVVQEVPVALIYNGISHAVMMLTPVDLLLFAKGFSLSEGILNDLSELYDIELESGEKGIQVQMTISSRAFDRLKQARRQLTGRSGCGLCGVESLSHFDAALAPVSTIFQPKWLTSISPAIEQLNTLQPISYVTGGAHAAAWVSNGEIIRVFEDVGRHNALDKLMGYLATDKVNLTEGYVLMSSRASYELVQKCIRMNVALLACVSAPTSFAIQQAQASGLKLAAFCRDRSFVLYS